jgi:hypothetical protein
VRGANEPVLEEDYCIDDHLQWAAVTLALEARRARDERVAESLIRACACVIAVARVLARLETLDLDNERELALQLPEMCADLGACFEEGAPPLPAFPEASASPSGGAVQGANDVVVSVPRQIGAWRRRPLCLHLDHDQHGAARLTVTGGRTQRGRRAVGAGMDLLRALVAMLGGSRDLNALRPGVSISVVLS